MSDAKTLELVEALREDYLAVRVLDDGSVAGLGRLMTTTAVHLGMTLHGWESRFCYADPREARKVFDALKSEDDVPAGWVASRPERPA